MLRITELLEKYRLSNVKAIDANGDTILHLVVEDEDFTAQETIEILRTLLDNGLDPNSENHLEETVLHLAIKTRARDVIDFLLERKVDLDNSAALYLIGIEDGKLSELENQSDDEMQKQEGESASFLEWMIARGLDIDSPDLYGQSALFSAIDYNLYHLLIVLLKYTNNIKSVSYESRRTLLHIVLGKKAETPRSPSYSRRYASSIVKVLLDRGVSPESVDSSLDTALHLAIKNFEDVDIVQLLIDHTKNFNRGNDKGETPFFIAVRECLDRKKRNIPDDYRKICQSLVMKGADVNEGNNSGFRPLHIFAEKTSSCKCLDQEKMELFEMLISVGCNVNAKNSHNETPLHIAAAGFNTSVVQRLIENGARINSRDNEGKTPLHSIADVIENSTTATVIAKMLIEHGANVNAKDCKGFTPLHKAAGEQDLCYDVCAILKLLLEHGANFSALSDEGFSVLHISVHNYHNSTLINDQFGYEEILFIEDISSSAFFRRQHHLDCELQFLLDHWIKLYAANIYHRMGYPFKTRRIRGGLRYYPESRKVYEDCMKEIEILKNTFIDNNRTSIYDFLHMNSNEKRAHVHNEKLQHLVHSSSQLEKQFPCYAILIISSYNEMLKRKSLMEPAKIAWADLTKTHLGDLCIEHIFSYLSNAEVYDLIEASEIDHYGSSSTLYDDEN